jgi:hypothetical protein
VEVVERRSEMLARKVARAVGEGGDGGERQDGKMVLVGWRRRKRKKKKKKTEALDVVVVAGEGGGGGVIVLTMELGCRKEMNIKSKKSYFNGIDKDKRSYCGVYLN